MILGTRRVPALVRSVGLPVRHAAGTDVVVGFPLGVAGVVTHAAELDVDGGILAAGVAGAIPGGRLGARRTGVASERTLRVALGATLTVVGAAFAIEAAPAASRPS